MMQSMTCHTRPVSGDTSIGIDLIIIFKNEKTRKWHKIKKIK
jgi:hypothetical protein